MNINKFTQKSIQAVQDCEKLAYEYGHHATMSLVLWMDILTGSKTNALLIHKHLPSPWLHLLHKSVLYLNHFLRIPKVRLRFGRTCKGAKA